MASEEGVLVSGGMIIIIDYQRGRKSYIVRDWCLVEIQYLLVTLFVNLGGCRSPSLLILDPVGLSAF